jgi:hypothetical protein
VRRRPFAILPVIAALGLPPSACSNADAPAAPAAEVTFEIDGVTVTLTAPAPCRSDAAAPGQFTEARDKLGIDFSYVSMLKTENGPEEQDIAGVAMADLDGDGALDLYFGNWGGPDGVYLTGGRGPLAFERVPNDGKASGAPVVSIVDVDGDGALDVLHGGSQTGTAWSKGDGRGGLGPRTLFPQVDPFAPIPAAHGFTSADVDGDGYLDICVAFHDVYLEDGQNWPASEWLTAMTDAGLVDRTDALDQSPIDDLTFACSLIDLDDDGDPDLIETNDAHSLASLGLDSTKPEIQGNRILRNDGGVFTDVSAGSNADIKISSMGIALGDYDNDGRPDLYVTSMPPLPSALLRNKGGLVFEDTTYDAEADTLFPEHDVGWGTVFVDADSDGWLDLFVLHGFHLDNNLAAGGVVENRPDQPNVLLRNRGDGTFEDVTESAGVSDRGWARSPAVGDLDRDGFPDLVVANADGRPAVLLNGCDDRPWLAVTLRSGSHNTRAIGARVRAVGTTAGAPNPKIQSRWVLGGGDGLYGSSAPEVHFGFPAGTDAVNLEVLWPDGKTSRIGGLPVRRHAELRRP